MWGYCLNLGIERLKNWVFENSKVFNGKQTEKAG